MQSQLHLGQSNANKVQIHPKLNPANDAINIVVIIIINILR
jgi:hypothetical protein